MTIRTVVSIWDADGDEHDRIVSSYDSTAYTAFHTYRKELSESDDKVTLGLGAVTTAAHLYLSTDEDITVYLNTDEVTVAIGAFLLLIGCAITTVEVIASSGANIFVHAAGA